MTRRQVAWVSLALAIVVSTIVALFVTGEQKAKRLESSQDEVTQLEAQNVLVRDGGPAADVVRQLATTRAALDKYRSVATAKAHGYVPDSPCGGGMGIHYLNRALLTPGRLQPTKPPYLLYAPKERGALELVAVEYFKPDADQNVKTTDDRPSLFGRAFDGPMAGHAPGMPIHYDLHVWLWKHNPSGEFAPWNPDVTCP